MATMLAWDIVKFRRQYFIKVKAILQNAILKVHGKLNYFASILCAAQILRSCMKYPVPTRENCHWDTTFILKDIWDEFFKYETNTRRIPMFRAFERIMLGTNEHDHYYRDRIRWWAEKIHQKHLSGEWKERMPIHPDRRIWWNEPVSDEDMERWLDNNVRAKVE